MIKPLRQPTGATQSRKQRRSVKQLRRFLQKTKVTTSSPTITPAAVTTPVPHRALTIPHIIRVLNRAGYYKFLRNKHNTYSGKQNAVRIVKAVAKFLDWSHINIENANIASKQQVLSWLRQVIYEHHTVITKYCSYLRKTCRFQPATVRIHALHLISACQWYLVYVVREPLAGMEGVKAIVADICRAQSGKERRQRAARTVEASVQQRRLPEGGLTALLEPVVARMAWARNLQGKRADKITYDDFMQLLYAAMYVSSAQGRQSGLMDLKYHQHKALLEKGFANTTRFKTQAKFRLQPVTLSALTKELLELYVRCLRPQAAQGATPAAQDPLWLKYDGDAEDSLGRKVVRFYKAQLQLHITTTAIRSMVETAMHEKYQDGEITKAQRESVQAINGHSSQVTQDYYVREDRAREVAQARSAFTVITQHALPDGAAGDGEEGQAPPQQPLLFPRWAERDQYRAIQWGADHPDSGNPACKKARWTYDEVRYIGDFCDEQRTANPQHATLVAACRKQILRDPDAHRIFHERHVLDVGRLRDGYRSYKNMIETGEWISQHRD